MRVKILAPTRVAGVHFDAGKVSSKFSDAEVAELVAAGKVEVVEDVDKPKADTPASGEQKEQGNG